MDRRMFNGWLAAATATLPLAGRAQPRRRDLRPLPERCGRLEAALGGRLGVSCVDVGTGAAVGWREHERFPLCSTFKWLAAAAVLDAADAGREDLERRVRIDAADLHEWAPIARRHVGGEGMSLALMCEAAIAHSDNTAAVKLVDAIGGIAGFNRYVRAVGDRVTRLDRGEPLMNEALPGDPRDTTSPAAMSADLRRLVLGDALSAASRRRLVAWMLDTEYSGKRLRADLPPGWRLADKTGTGNSGTGVANDVGVYWPPLGAPVVLSVYIAGARVPRDEQEAAIATVGRWIHELA